MDRDHAVVPPNRFALGNVVLDIDARTITGPRGEICLRNQLFAIAARLMRRPGVVVATTDLISEMYVDPDDEPDTADVMLRIRVKQLRATLEMLSPDRIRITHERGIGYKAEVCRLNGKAR